MLNITDLSVSYGAHRALEGVSVNVEPGEIVVILGANGAGKSSLLKAIAGTCEGQLSGSVNLDGLTLSGGPAEQIVKHGIAFVPEGRGIFADMTVEENLMLGAHAIEARAHQATNLKRVHELFPKLRERSAQVARTMSGGEQQMVAIGRAMMANPSFLMLDEPSLGLSPLLCKELFQSLAHIRDAGIGILMVEQNAKQSLGISDRAYLLENGSIVGEGEAQVMMNDPAVQAAYLGGASASESQKTARLATSHPLSVNDSDAQPSSADGHEQSSRRFIQPGSHSSMSTGTELLTDIAIDSLVAHAAELAERKDSSTKDSAMGVHAPTRSMDQATSLSSTNTGASANGISVSSIPSLDKDDPDVRDLLTSFEMAAEQSRIPHRNISIDQEQDDTDDKSLPHIPVYRKSTVKVFRRNPAGDLIKVEER